MDDVNGGQMSTAWNGPISSFSLLFGDREAGFFGGAYESSYLHVSGRGQDYFRQLFSLGKAEELLWQQEMRFRELVRFHKDGADVTPPSFVVQLDYFKWATEQFRNGASIIFNTLEDCSPALAVFVRNMELTMMSRVSAAAYITPSNARAFDEHFDTHDVIIAQIEGAKTYLLRRSTSVPNLPHRRQQTDIEHGHPGEDVADVHLEAGDVLYIPRGLLHSARAEAEHSLHLTFSLHPSRLADLVLTAVELATEQNPDLRRTASHMRGTADVAGVIRDVMSAVGATISYEEVLARQHQKFVGRLRPLPSARLRSGSVGRQIEADDAVEKVPGAICTIQVVEPALRLSFPGTGVIRDADRMPTRLEFPATASDLVDFIAQSTGSFCAKDIPSRLSEASTLLVLNFLLREGLLQFPVSSE